MAENMAGVSTRSKQGSAEEKMDDELLRDDVAILDEKVGDVAGTSGQAAKVSQKGKSTATSRKKDQKSSSSASKSSEKQFFEKLQQTMECLSTGMQSLSKSMTEGNKSILEKLSTQDYPEYYEEYDEEYDENFGEANLTCARKKTHEMSDDENEVVTDNTRDKDPTGADPTGVNRTADLNPTGEKRTADVQLQDEPPRKSVKQAFMDDLSMASGKQEQRGPKIDDTMATGLNIMMRSKLEETEQLRKDTFPPANCDGLCSVKVNAEVWARISALAKHKDLKMQNVGNHLVAGTTQLAYLVDNFTKHWDQDTGILDPKQAEVILSHAQKAFKLLGAANYELQMRRREVMKTDMNASHVHLCAPSVPYTTELFGDDVTKKITEITSQNRVAGKAFKEYVPRGRGKSRGRGRYPRGRSYRGRGYSYSNYNQSPNEQFYHEQNKGRGQPQNKKKTNPDQ